MEIQEMIDVLEAAKAGKTIQLKSTIRNEEFRDIFSPEFNFLQFDYRVKPEPREWTMTACPTRNVLCDCSKNGICDGREMELVRVREVLE